MKDASEKPNKHRVVCNLVMQPVQFRDISKAILFHEPRDALQLQRSGLPIRAVRKAVYVESVVEVAKPKYVVKGTKHGNDRGPTPFGTARGLNNVSVP